MFFSLPVTLFIIGLKGELSNIIGDDAMLGLKLNSCKDWLIEAA